MSTKNTSKLVKSVELFNEADLDKAVEKAEVTEKAEKPKTVKKATTKKAVAKKAEKTEKVEKSQSTEKPKKVVAKKAEKPAKEQAEKPKKVTKKAEKVEKVEAQEKEQELRSLTSIKVAKTEYTVDESIKSYEDLVKAIEGEKDVYAAFDISNVESKEYENIFHVPYEKSMKEKFDICTPIFVGEKNPRLVFASIYTEALWDLFPDEFDLLSAVLVEKPSKTKK